MSVSRDLRELAGRAADQGWRVVDRGEKVLFYSPDGKTIVTAHKTPSDRNWRKQMERQMKKGGYAA